MIGKIMPHQGEGEEDSDEDASDEEEEEPELDLSGWQAARQKAITGLKELQGKVVELSILWAVSYEL